MNAAISATYVALSVTLLLLYWDNYKSALGQAQQQFQNYQNPTLGFGIQYPSDWQIEEEPGEQVTFVKEKDIVQFLVDVHNLDSSDTTLAKYVQDEITSKGEERQDFKLIESTPITISDGKAQAHKLVYTFLKEDDARAGETNKIQRIFTIEGDKVYSIAYLAGIDKFDDSLPLVEKMVDSFRLSDTGSGSSTTQVQSSDGSGEDNNGSGDCDHSYPDVCIKSPPPNLNCPGVPYKNFKVIGADPHGFDGDNDGIGCESADGGGNGNGDCDPSYPDVCIKSPPPNLNCPDIPNKNFRVTGGDPHDFDRDNDGIGCDSGTPTSTPTPEPVACDDIPGSAGLKFPQNHLTECEIEEWEDCKKLPGGSRSTERCDIVYEIINDHDCFGYASQEECDADLPMECPANHSLVTNDKGEEVCRDDIEAAEDAKEEDESELPPNANPIIPPVVQPPTPEPEPIIDNWGEEGLMETDEESEVEVEEVPEDEPEDEPEGDEKSNAGSTFE